MNTEEIDALPESVRADIADTTIGFVRLETHHNEQDAIPAGSGSLVTFGSIEGILTAAHVLEELPRRERVGLVLFPRRQPNSAQQPTIEMELTEPLVLRGTAFGAEGPDLGFLRLSPSDVSALKARGHVFVNMAKRRVAVLSRNEAPPYFDGISGVIAEWTKELPDEGRSRVKRFNALYGVGLVVGKHEAHGYDLLDFEVTYDEGSTAPNSFGGVSGGGLWRVYLTKDANGRLSVRDRMLFGVAFFQSGVVDEKRIITCHGLESVYGKLFDCVRERWP